MKKLVNFRLSIELINKLDEYSKNTGKSKTVIIEEALRCLFDKEERQDKDIKLLEKQNYQLQQTLQSFNVALQSKDDLLKEKDERIKELKEMIEILKQQNNKNWWQFWK